MAINARMLTSIELPDEVEIEIEDTIKGTTVVRTVDFRKCLANYTGLRSGQAPGN